MRCRYAAPFVRIHPAEALSARSSYGVLVQTVVLAVAGDDVGVEGRLGGADGDDALHAVRHRGGAGGVGADAVAGDDGALRRSGDLDAVTDVAREEVAVGVGGAADAGVEGAVEEMPRRFATVAVPAALVPMRLPAISLPFAAAPVTVMPALALPEITLRLAEVPMTLSGDFSMTTPYELPRAVVPSAAIPM